MPSTIASQHLKAHFWVSRFNFCRSAPPDPNATLAAAHPLSAIAFKMTLSDSYLTEREGATRATRVSRECVHTVLRERDGSSRNLE